MKIKTSELTDAALDWAVAKHEGTLPASYDDWAQTWPRYSTNWAQGGPIIEREHIALSWVVSNYLHVAGCWSAYIPQTDGKILYAPTPLIAAMRYFVARKLGGEVEIPDELLS